MKYYSSDLVCNILDYIKDNLNDEIKIDYFVKKYYFNRTYIMKKFKKDLGISIINYINIERIYQSLKYYHDDKTILEIALKNGFNSQEYYSEIFKKIVGTSPMDYKKYIKRIISIKKERIIQDHLLRIEDMHLLVRRYLDNRKPIVTIKSLSLYK